MLRYPWKLEGLLTRRLTAPLFLVTTLSCVGATSDVPAGASRAPASGAAGADDSGVGDVPVSSEPEVEVESVGDQVVDDGWIFSRDRVHSLEIELPPESWDGLQAAPREYVPADIVFDGFEVEDVGMRLRGKLGSFRTLDGKPKIRLDFNRYLPGRQFHGLEALSLNASLTDCSYVKEPLVYTLFEAMGVRTSRAAFVRVTVNDMDYGLYVLVETQDDRLLDRHWGDFAGNLYDGKYVLWADGSYTLLDFGEGHDTLFELEEGEDVGHADIRAISEAYLAGDGAGAILDRTAVLLDWDNLHRVWAVSQYVGQNDGYALNKNNYRIHFRASDGRAEMVPWDFDHSFYEDHWWSRSWASPSGNLARACFQDPTCWAGQQAAVAELLAVLPDLDLPARNAELQALTAWHAENDPRRECGVSDVHSTRAHVTTWLTTRADYMRSFWGL